MEKIILEIEEQNKVKQLKKDILSQLIELGGVAMDLDEIEKIQNQLKTEYKNFISTLNKLQETEKNLITELSNKYGEGANVNLDTFEVTYNK